MSAHKINKSAKELLIYLAILAILVLTAVNINSILTPKKDVVLGVETENTEATFWNEFLNKNPDYIPGLLEIGETEKAHEIDPNYVKP